MNIRSVSNPAQIMGKEKIEATQTIKSDETAEREANGQQPFSDSEPHRPLTEEEADQVLEKIKNHEGVQKNGLTVKLEEINGQKIVIIEDPKGQVVKRFVERDLFFFLQQSDSDEIHLVNKSA
jgi:hypothetical protein